jgi:zinc protease
MDPAIKRGVLANGLTYYIMHNKEPNQRASFYIIQNTGAMLEEESQIGMAHFIEHMAFNGTKHFPGKSLVNTLEKYGISFGQNINAYTSHDETVYNISNVPVDKPLLIDTCLLMLYDWAAEIQFTAKETDLEKGVITEEWRSNQNASSRLRKKIGPVLFNNAKYAYRDIIGDPEVIKTFKPETLNAFYKTWFRPDLQAIAVVGDIDVKAVEEKITGLFGKIPAKINAPVRPVHLIPEHKETLFAALTDNENPRHSVNIYIKHRGWPLKDKNSMAYYRNDISASLANSITGSRISEMLQKPDPQIITGDISFGGLVRGYNMLTISAIAHPGKAHVALRTIYTEAQRIAKHGFTQAELERAKKEFLTFTENSWKEKDKIPNEQHINAIIGHYIWNEPLESIDQTLELTRKFLQEITLDEVSATAKKWIGTENRSVIVLGPGSSDTRLLTQSEAFAILAEVEASNPEPYSESMFKTTLIEKELPGSKIVKSRDLKEIGAKEWTLANGAKVVFRKADFQKDEVLLQAYSPGGHSLYSPDMLAAAFLTPNFITAYGLGGFDAPTLTKLLTGKFANLSFSVSGLYETFTGSSSVTDFETILQMLYLYFEEPRFDRQAYNTYFDRIKSSATDIDKNPRKVMSDSLQLILNNYSKRVKLMNTSLFDEITYEKIENIYLDRFKDAGDFTFFIVGNIDEIASIPLIEKYIGSIKDNPRKENWKNTRDGMPKGFTRKSIKIPQQTDKSNIVITWNSKARYSPKSNLQFDVLAAVLRLRFTDEIREKAGGTYGVHVSQSNSRLPEQRKTLQVSFETEPAKAGLLKDIVYSELDKIRNEGPSVADLDKVKAGILKERQQYKANNSYWMGVLTTYYLNGYNSDSPDNYENILNSLTADDLKKFAGLFFRKSDIAEVVFLPDK